jgi:hypothetical protein
MRKRGPTGRRPVTPLRPGIPGTVQGWEVLFDLPGIAPIEPCMAVAVRASAAEAIMHGVLYELSAYDYETLRLSEGMGSPVPSYTEQEVMVLPYGKDKSEAVSALVFGRETKTQNLRQNGVYPSKRYLTLIAAGHVAAGLNPECGTVKYVKEHPAVRESGEAMRLISMLSFGGMLTLRRTRLVGHLIRDVVNPGILKMFGRAELARERGDWAAWLAWMVAWGTCMLPFVIFGLTKRGYVNMSMAWSEQGGAKNK